MSGKDEQLHLLTEVAAMYFLDGLSQDEIAGKIYTSRSTVSRMLRQAREKNLVTVSINFVPGRNHYYENKLHDLFGIEAVVVNTADAAEETAESVCREFASWIDLNLSSSSVVGMTRSSMIYRAGAMCQPKVIRRNVNFVQLMGTESRTSKQVIAQDIIRQFADLYHGRAYFLDAPLVFFNDEARDELMKVPSIHQTLALARSANLILTSLPRITPGDENHIWNGFVTQEIFEEIVSSGGVGCILGRVFDIHGRFLDIRLNRSIVGADIDVLRTAHVAAACYGAEFAVPVLGALRGALVRTLITDSDCVGRLLQLI